MKAKRKIYFFIGTTTELVRISPILKELIKRKISYKIIASGQNHIHLDHINQYVKNIKINIQLVQKNEKSSAIRFALWSIKAFLYGLYSLHNEFKELNKDNSHFIIFGDPVSTSLGAIIAKIYGLHIVHLESGDFSFDLKEPFPEEICRNINVYLSDILFPPSKWALENIRKKHIDKPMINTFYNTQVEVFQWAMKKKPSKSLLRIQKQFKKYYILIMHRQEHVFFRKDWTKEVLRYVIQNAPPHVTCIMFDHPLSNAIVSSIQDTLTKKQRDNIKALSMLSYSDFLHLVEKSEFVASDSATNQYETFLLGKPYLSLRERTEQIEGLGENVVLAKGNKIVMKNFLKNYSSFRRKKVNIRKRPSSIIVDYLAQ